jgi:hypothetical protein
MAIPDVPQNLIGDNAYGSDRLDAEQRFYGIELIGNFASVFTVRFASCRIRDAGIK